MFLLKDSRLYEEAVAQRNSLLTSLMKSGVCQGKGKNGMYLFDISPLPLSFSLPLSGLIHASIV